MRRRRRRHRQNDRKNRDPIREVEADPNQDRRAHRLDPAMDRDRDPDPTQDRIDQLVDRCRAGARRRGDHMVERVVTRQSNEKDLAPPHTDPNRRRTASDTLRAVDPPRKATDLTARKPLVVVVQ